MKGIDISSMFLIPKRLYRSLFSYIDEDSTKEELTLLNRQRDDGNYIENAINFNKQQEMQNKKLVIQTKPEVPIIMILLQALMQIRTLMLPQII